MNHLKFVDMRMRKFNQAAVPNFLTEEFAQKRKVQSEPMVLTSLIFSERITVPVPVTHARNLKRLGVDSAITAQATGLTVKEVEQL